MTLQRPYEDNLRDQIAEGRRMAREDGGSDPIVYRQAPKRSFTPGKKDLRPKGHEGFLKGLENSFNEGKPADILVIMMDGTELIGSVKCSDKYTITLRTVAQDGEVENWVLFKHDISRFRALQAKSKVTGDQGAESTLQ